MGPFLKKNKKITIITSISLIALILISIMSFILINSQKSRNNIDPNQSNARNTLPNDKKNQENQIPKNLGDANSLDPLEKGRALSNGNCAGTGSKRLGSAPMKAEDTSVIIPYGLVIGGHVTPIDHQYYWGKIQMGNPDMYDVLAPGDGKIVGLEYRDRSRDGGKVKGDYRGVIMYSCTFFSYFDLATSLTEEIQAKLPKGWESKGNLATDIDVKQGQVIGKVGGQSLDFAVWDTTKTLTNLLVPTAYNNGEPWKLNTVPPLDYFTDEVKTKILPLYANQSLKQDGTIDQDIDGKAAGNWFLEGTNGYAGVFEYGPNGGGIAYYTGHLSFARNHVDPTGWILSIGDLEGKPQQFTIKSPKILPSELDINSKIVKYELIQTNYIDEKGNPWVGQAPAQSIKMLSTGETKGTVLVQLLSKRKLKIEIFMGKTPSQVSSFTSKAKTFDRGDNAKMVTSNTAY